MLPSQHTPQRPRHLPPRYFSPAQPEGPTIKFFLRRNAAKRSGRKSRLLIYDSLLSHTHIVRKLTFLGVQKCGCVTIGYPRKKVIRARSLKNGSILYEDFELRNEVTVTFPIEGIFQNFFNFKLPHTHGTLSLKFEDRLTNTTHGDQTQRRSWQARIHRHS